MTRKLVLAAGNMESVPLRIVMAFLLGLPMCLAGCGGGGGGSGGGGQTAPPPPAAQTYSVSATVNGLSSTGLVLLLNGGNALEVAANGLATFTTKLSSGSSYAVTVGTQPGGETCTVASGTGTVASADVSAPVVNCTPNSTPQYTVTVNVTGFVSGPTLVLQLSGGSQLAITGNGSATFSTLLGTGENYLVTVKSQPAPPPQQTCSVTNGTGTIGTSNVANVSVTCIVTYTVSVSVSGIAGSGLVVQLNGADDLQVPVKPPYSGPVTATFTSPVAMGATYSVTIKSQPVAPAQLCTISNASGIMGAARVIVPLVCPLVYSVSTRNQWTPMTPPTVDGVSLNGRCDALNIPYPLNTPPVHDGGVSWTDSSNNLWLFGGISFDWGLASNGRVNDLWTYAPADGTWTCVSLGASASFGTKGMASASNWPPPLTDMSSTFDAATQTLWLFGGDYNALWRYDLGTGYWTWVSGSSVLGASGSYGAQGTAVPGNVPGARTGSAVWRDLKGNLWLFGGRDSAGSTGDLLNDLWEYNPGTGLWVWVAGSVAGTQGAGPKGIYGTKGVGSSSNTPGGREHFVGWTDAAGNLWLFGGLGMDSSGKNGELNDLWKYTPSVVFGQMGTWTWVAGSSTAAARGIYGTRGIASVGNIPGGRDSATAWTDGSGQFWLFGGFGCAASACSGSSPTGLLSDLWKYSPAANTWTWMAGSTTLGATSPAGTPGVPAPANTPGGLANSASWTDLSGNLWLYGGWNGQLEIFGLQLVGGLWVYTPQ